jgi:Leucine-rich repeat (LRR) protein
MDLRNRDLQDGLFLDKCNLTSQPDFSDVHARALDLAENSIGVLFEQFLPQGIQVVDFSYNYIYDDGLPDWWPDTLEELYLTGNSIRNQDVNLWSARNLKVLCLSKNPLQHLPGHLPFTLERLYVDKTQIKRTGLLPPHLKVFSAAGACLRSIRIPRTVEKLFLQRNFLQSAQLPRDWGTQLEILNLEHNKLTHFPKGLPDSLRVLKLSYNEITSIPEDLPEKLTFLAIGHNKIRSVALTKRKTPIQCVCVMNNQLTVVLKDEQAKNNIQWASSILEEDNWNTDEYSVFARTLQKAYRNYRLKKILRTWKKQAQIREELLATSMHPSRAGQYEDVSPEWNHWGC